MYGKFVAFFRGVWSRVVGSAVMLSMLCVSAFAQTSQSITVEAPNIDWTSIPSQIMTALTTPVIVGIGIALSIWVIFAGISFFRRSSRA